MDWIGRGDGLKEEAVSRMMPRFLGGVETSLRRKVLSKDWFGEEDPTGHLPCRPLKKGKLALSASCWEQ